MKTLLLIPGTARPTTLDAPDSRPRSEFAALAKALESRAGGQADMLDYADADADRSMLVRLARRCAGRDAALALMAFRRRAEYDNIWSAQGGVGLCLALLFRAVRARPGHVVVVDRFAHTAANVFWSLFKAHAGIDTCIVYGQRQRDFAEDQLGFPAEKLLLTSPAIDEHFFRPAPLDPAASERIVTFCADGACSGAPAILEAMAQGKAVIVSASACPADLVTNGLTGLVLMSGDSDSCTGARARLQADSALRDRLGRAARRWVEENATLERWAEQIRSALTESAASASRGCLPDACGTTLRFL